MSVVPILINQSTPVGSTYPLGHNDQDDCHDELIKDSGAKVEPWHFMIVDMGQTPVIILSTPTVWVQLDVYPPYRGWIPVR